MPRFFTNISRQNEVLTEAEWSQREQLKHMLQNRTVSPFAQEDGIPDIDVLPNKSCERLYMRLRHQISIRAEINFSLTQIAIILRPLKNLDLNDLSIEEQLKKVQVYIDELKSQTIQLLDYKEMVVQFSENYSVLSIEELLGKLLQMVFSSKNLHANWCSIKSNIEQIETITEILIQKESEILAAKIDNNDSCTTSFKVKR